MSEQLEQRIASLEALVKTQAETITGLEQQVKVNAERADETLRLMDSAATIFIEHVSGLDSRMNEHAEIYANKLRREVGELTPQTPGDKAKSSLQGLVAKHAK